MVQVSKVFVMFLLLISVVLIVWFYMKKEWKKSSSLGYGITPMSFYSWDV